MTTKAARTLDIIITYIEPERVYYGFPVGELCIVYADMYAEGKFDLSTIEVSKRYRVVTKKIPCLVFNPKAQNYTYQDMYVWVKATEVVDPVAKLAARTAKQRKAAESLAATPLVDSGRLFAW